MRRVRPVDDPFLRAALELHSYSRSLLGFIDATAAKRDILSDFDREPGGVVLDVGAYDGVWASSMHAAAWAAHSAGRLREQLLAVVDVTAALVSVHADADATQLRTALPALHALAVAAAVQ